MNWGRYEEAISMLQRSLWQANPTIHDSTPLKKVYALNQLSSKITP
jgi:hypothetical protein